MGRWLAAIVVGAPTAMAFDMISLTSHHGQWSRASFKNSEKMIFVPTHKKIKRAM
jgi:hypothetical protein